MDNQDQTTQQDEIPTIPDSGNFSSYLLNVQKATKQHAQSKNISEANAFHEIKESPEEIKGGLTDEKHAQLAAQLAGKEGHEIILFFLEVGDENSLLSALNFYPDEGI